MGRNALFLLICLAVLFVSSCEHEKVLGLGDPTLANIQQKIFTPRCAVSGCHVAGGNGPMPLTSTQESYDNLVNQPSIEVTTLQIVEPMNPADSYLIIKLTGELGIVGDTMPQGGGLLPADEIQLIRDWIQAGAAR